MTDRDYALHRKVQEVTNLVVGLSEKVSSVSGQVRTVEDNQQRTRTELSDLRDEFLAFVTSARLAANVQRAETRIGVIQDQVDHEFGHHKTVRRTAVGMLQAFDLGLVSQETVRTVGDELMIQTPRYWLAPALVALASWSADDRELCERAVDEAFRRAPDRTSLFFALVLRRQGREASAVRWLRHYLLAQDPAALGREFAVILESIAQGAFGLAGRELLARTLTAWRSRLLDQEEIQRKQVKRWLDEIDSLRGPATADEFPRLSLLTPQWPQLDAALRAARTQQTLLDKYRAILDQEFRPSQRIEDAVDDILDRLVSEYDDEELPLRRDLAFNRAVVDQEGDVGAARKDADADAASYDETLDYLTVQTTAALNPAAIGTSAATQRLAVASCHEWFLQAHTGFTRDYRSKVPDDVQARYQNALTVAGKQFRLPAWTVSFNRNLPELEQSLGDHWDRHIDPFIASLAYPTGEKVTPLVIVLVGILVLVGSFHIGAALGTALVTGAVWGLFIRNGLRAARRVQDGAREHLGRNKQQSVLQLRTAAAELTDWNEKFRAADAVEARGRDLIKSLENEVHGGGSPFEGRTVRAGTKQAKAKEESAS
ncbi:hypothetical protein [Streptomyces lasiicapitis]|uniref:Uncharacterized protein n=1 Tax=Streptomyces lasiicapitis TaxID=1923961 RepID=A0ABQ2LIN9_9ACTN|nr:hypothetical protein [Streptomyces lasiicapitis]GGO34825.1 hypothetical protein GCM10012286_04520 [Streptomyces lasiicapitis]